MIAAYIVGFLSGMCLVIAINLVGSWFLDRYFEERG